MNRAASITAFPSLFECHPCCTRQPPLDYDKLKLSWNQFALSPKWLCSCFRPSGLLGKRKRLICFLQKRCREPQRLGLRWKYSGLIMITKGEHLCLKMRWKHLHIGHSVVSPGAEALECSSALSHVQNHSRTTFSLFFLDPSDSLSCWIKICDNTEIMVPHHKKLDTKLFWRLLLLWHWCHISLLLICSVVDIFFTGISYYSHNVKE